MFSIAQRCLRILAHLDILMFFGVILGSAVTETYICNTEPILLLDYGNLDWFGILPILQNANSNNDTDPDVDGCAQRSNDSKSNNSICSNKYNQSTIWDYRINIIDQAREHGMGLYHIAYLFCWLIIVAYFLLEISQYCVLLKGINVRRLNYLYKWIAVRIVILGIVLTIVVYDVIGLQLTCTDLFVLPLSGFRLMFLFAVIIFSSRVKVGSSSETIVMTGSEKL